MVRKRDRMDLQLSEDVEGDFEWWDGGEVNRRTVYTWAVRA